MSENNSKLKKKPSGYEYRKRKAEKEHKFEQSKKFMTIDKYVVQKDQDDGTKDLEKLSASSSLDTNILIEPAEPVELFEYNNAPVQIQEQEILGNEVLEVHDQKSKDKKFEDNKTQETLNLNDCGTWPVLRGSTTVDYLIKIGPIQIKKENYPGDEKGRHFSSSYYNRKLSPRAGQSVHAT